MKKKFSSKIVMIALFAIVAIPLAYAINIMSEGFQSNPGTLTIDAPPPPGDACTKVNNASGKSYFVPTKTASEWTAFKNALPPSVSLESCVAQSPTAQGFTTPGVWTWNKPAGVIRIDVRVFGGGGGGGGGGGSYFQYGTYAADGGGGGGSGGYQEVNNIDVTSISSISLVVGAGGGGGQPGVCTYNSASCTGGYLTWSSTGITLPCVSGAASSHCVNEPEMDGKNGTGSSFGTYVSSSGGSGGQKGACVYGMNSQPEWSVGGNAGSPAGYSGSNGVLSSSLGTLDYGGAGGAGGGTFYQGYLYPGGNSGSGGYWYGHTRGYVGTTASYYGGGGGGGGGAAGPSDSQFLAPSPTEALWCNHYYTADGGTGGNARNGAVVVTEYYN